MKRRILWLLVLSLGFLVLAGATLLTYAALNRDPVNHANYQRINEGMTVEEVEKILTQPGKKDVAVTWARDGAILMASEWESDEGSMLIFFDSDGKMKRKLWLNSETPGFFQRLRSLIGLGNPPVPTKVSYQ